MKDNITVVDPAIHEIRVAQRTAKSGRPYNMLVLELSDDAHSVFEIMLDQGVAMSLLLLSKEDKPAAKG